MIKKNIHLLAIPPISTTYLPLLWASAKTYYEKNGQHPEKYNWILPIAELMVTADEIKDEIRKNPPDIFGASLYVWNYSLSMEICSWVKQEWPHCIVIIGGPHQYIIHQSDFFMKFKFIDACSPDTAYGEIVMADLLDNFNDGLVDWSKVEQIMYPSTGRNLINRSLKMTRASEFVWDFDAYSTQLDSMRRYARRKRFMRSTCSLDIRIETTRGCPYMCTYCDWGGTLGSKMARKTYEAIDKDLNILSMDEFDISCIYFCDSNTGIFGDRDVDTFRLLIEKTNNLSIKKPIINIGGWAKSSNHIKYIKEIITIAANSGALDSLKISAQTFNQRALKNVKRTDIAAPEYFILARYARELGCVIIAEMIMGLPGMTVDTFYEDFNIPYEEDVEMRLYELELLPQSEAFSRDYRNKFKIGTAIHNNRNPDSLFNIASETVVETYSYSRKDYTDMMTIYSIYVLFTIGKIYSGTIKQVINDNNWRMSDFLRIFYEECYPEFEKVGGKHSREFNRRKISHTTVKLYTSYAMSTVYSLLLLEDFWNMIDDQLPILKIWLLSKGADRELIDVETKEILENNTDEERREKSRIRYIDATTIRSKIKTKPPYFFSNLGEGK